MEILAPLFFEYSLSKEASYEQHRVCGRFGGHCHSRLVLFWFAMSFCALAIGRVFKQDMFG